VIAELTGKVDPDVKDGVKVVALPVTVVAVPIVPFTAGPLIFAVAFFDWKLALTAPPLPMME